jgi:hypothetical protein
MKKVSKRFIFIAIVAVMGLSFAAPVFAGGSSAKSLAKQTLDLTKKAADLEKKAAEIEGKAAALSARDRRTYQDELARLGFEAPEGLFYDPVSLISGAEEADDSTIGGILGGLVGLARGSGNNSGAASTSATGSGGTTAPSGSSSSSVGANAPTSTTAPSSGSSSGGILGGRTGAFFSMFDGKNYHMKAKTIIPGSGMDLVTETYIKGDMMASVSEVMGMTTRSIIRDNMTFVIMDTTRTYMVIPSSASSGNPSEEPIRTSGLVMTGSGAARFDGRNLPYEEYSISSEGYTIKMQWFLDGNNLAGIRTITNETTIDMVILALDQNVPNSMFEIPDGYQRMEMPQMPGGY